jgi:hypothetical protein
MKLKLYFIKCLTPLSTNTVSETLSFMSKQPYYVFEKFQSLLLVAVSCVVVVLS